MAYTDDPVRDFMDHDRKQSDALKRRKICADCGEPITEGGHYEFEEKCYCIYCAEAYHWKKV